MKRLITLLFAIAITISVSAQSGTYRMFVHQGPLYGMEALTDDIERISVKDNNMVEIQTNTQLYTYHIDVIDSITFHDVEEGMLPGIFSVAENKTVHFSKGNLQYHPVKNNWRFAENQHAYIGNDNSMISASYNGWLDLFGWGTSGWKGGGEYCNPWDWVEQNYLSSSFGPQGEYNLTGEYANADWAYFNSISNGAVITEQWRTLLNEEWTYLFNERDNASNLRGRANVCNVNGFILLPDNWSAPSGCSFSPNANNYNTNVYNETQWEAMENAGAVFLPAAGARAAVTLDEVGVAGHYWSASYYNINMAYSFLFDQTTVMPNCFYYLRYLGLSVRAVTDM